jgi:transcriptional regulator with XRE-family HTH domain
MIIGDRIRTMREEKKLSQGDIEKRTGLLRCYISRVENGHTQSALSLGRVDRNQGARVLSDTPTFRFMPLRLTI